MTGIKLKERKKEKRNRYDVIDKKLIFIFRRFSYRNLGPEFRYLNIIVDSLSSFNQSLEQHKPPKFAHFYIATIHYS